jgi:hypothetical protein
MTNIYTVPQPKFSLGELYITAAVDKTLAPEEIQTALVRHARGDWGDVSADDRDENESALGEARRLMSVYRDSKGVEFWIITEADRNVTTVLLPDDY